MTTGGLGPLPLQPGPLPSAQGNPWPALAGTKGPLPSPGRPLLGPQSALGGPCPTELPLAGSPPQACGLHTRPPLPSEPSVFTPPAIRGLQTRAPRGPRQLPAYFPVLRQQDGAGQLGLLLPAPPPAAPPGPHLNDNEDNSLGPHRQPFLQLGVRKQRRLPSRLLQGDPSAWVPSLMSPPSGVPLPTPSPCCACPIPLLQALGPETPCGEGHLLPPSLAKFQVILTRGASPSHLQGPELRDLSSGT